MTILMTLLIAVIAGLLLFWLAFSAVVLHYSMEQYKQEKLPTVEPEPVETDTQIVLTRFAVEGLRDKRYRAFRYCV